MKPVCNLDAKFTVFVITAQSLCVSSLLPVQKIQELCKPTNPGLSAYISRYFATKCPQASGDDANRNTTEKEIKSWKQNNTTYTALIYSVTSDRGAVNFLRQTAAYLRVITALSMRSILPHFVSRSSSKQHFCSCVTHNSKGPGIELWWGWHFPQPSTPELGPYQPQVQLVPGYLSRWVRRPEGGVDNHPI